MNPIIEQRLLDYLHQQTCPYCGASLQDVSVTIIHGQYNSPMYSIDNTHCDKEEQYLLDLSAKWLDEYPQLVLRESERLNRLYNGR